MSNWKLHYIWKGSHEKNRIFPTENERILLPFSIPNFFYCPDPTKLNLAMNLGGESLSSHEISHHLACLDIGVVGACVISRIKVICDLSKPMNRAFHHTLLTSEHNAAFRPSQSRMTSLFPRAFFPFASKSDDATIERASERASGEGENPAKKRESEP